MEQSTAFSTLKHSVGKTIYILWMMQVKPGREKSICTEFFSPQAKEDRENPSASDHQNSYEGQLYYSLSEYDIIGLTKSDRDIGGMEAQGVLDYQQILCFPWASSSHDDKDFCRLADNDGHAAMTVSFIKLEEPFVNKVGIEGEIDFVERLEGKLKGKVPYYSIFGTMGLPELILVLKGENLQTLLEMLRDLLVQSNELQPYLTFLHTIPCIKHDLAQKYFDNEIAKNSSALLGELYWRITASCTPQQLANLMDELIQRGIQDNFSVLSTYGQRDIEIFPLGNKKTSVEKLLQTLGIIRHVNPPLISSFDVGENPARVISTYTTITVDPKQVKSSQIDNDGPLADSIYRENILEYYKKCLQQELSKIVTLKEFENKMKNPSMKFVDGLKQVLLRTQSMLENPELAELGLDTIDYAIWAAESAVQFANEYQNRPGIENMLTEIRRNFSSFDELVRAYSYGLNQRLIGVHFSESDPAQSFSGIHGLGIQRNLRAVNAIPRALLSGFRSSDQEEDWNGFTVFDYFPNTLILANRIINIPFSQIDDPSEWWILGHETGHAFCMNTGIANRPFIKKFADRLAKDEQFTHLGIAADEFAEELIATVFEYQFCFRANFDLHLKAVWRYFNHYLSGGEDGIERTTEYFLRSVFTYFYHLEHEGILLPGLMTHEHISKGREQKSLSNHDLAQSFNLDLDQSLIYRAWGEVGTIQNFIKNHVLNPVQEIAGGLKHELRQVNLDLVVYIYSLCEDLREEIIEIFNEFENEGIKILDPAPDYKKIRGLLEDGRIVVFERPMDLFLIPLALNPITQILNSAKPSEMDKSIDASDVHIRNDKTVSFSIPDRAKIAAVLSLWHWDRMQTSRRWNRNEII
jgi:hypothetical protein